MVQALEDARAARSSSQPLLAAIHVDGLFGKYTYDIIFPTSDRRLLLLHGDNGSGKTTVLRLVWNLLSPANTHGHRTFLASTPFRSISVHFVNETSITARKSKALTGAYTIEVESPLPRQTFTSVWPYNDDNQLPPQSQSYDAYLRALLGQKEGALTPLDIDPEDLDGLSDVQRVLDKQEESRQRYINFLQTTIASPPILLADDRSLYTDDPTHERVRERMNLRGDRRPSRSTSFPRSSEIVDLELKIAIQRVNELLRSLTLGGQNTGSAGANSIYRDVLSQLASPGLSESGSVAAERESTSRRPETLLDKLAKESPRFEEFNLVPHFAAKEFSRILRSVPPSRRSLADDILVPYLDSLQTRMSALEEAERLLRSFIDAINFFLLDKQAHFSPRDGIIIETEDRSRLGPASLSSGERQLMMLLTTTVLAGREGKLFIIDEPELSLGVRWQRDILETLLELTAGTSLQFIVATHSIEVVTSQPKSLVKLIHRADG